MQWVNVSFAVYSKGTTTTPPALLYGPAPANTLWTGFGGPCETRNDGDPIVRYDHLADRWVMSQLAIPNSFFGIALRTVLPVHRGLGDPRSDSAPTIAISSRSTS